MTRIALLLFVVLTAIVGCGSPPAAQTAVPAPPAPPSSRPVEHPDYAAWKKFKPGTVVKRRAVVSRADSANKVVATETFTLIELTPAGAVVERQKTVERIGEEARVDVAPPERRTAPATFALPEGMVADEFAKPSRDAKLTGEEVVTVAGKEYKCRVYTFSNGTEAGPMAIRVWWCDEMPGRLVKQTMGTPNGNATEETVTDVTVP